MGQEELANLAFEYRQRKTEAAAAETNAEILGGLIKRELEERGEETVAAGIFVIRYKTIAASRFDARLFRERHPDLFQQFQTVSETKRFTVD